MRYAMVGALFAIVFCAGCSSSKGGQARHENGEFTIKYNGVEIHDTREIIATTQPSVVSAGGQGARITPAKEGELGGVSFDQMKQKNTAGSIAVAAMFLVIGGGLGALLWFTGNRIASIVIAVTCLAGAGLAFLYPFILGIAFAVVLCAGLAYGVWSVLHFRNQVVAATSAALNVAAVTDPTGKLVKQFKTAMATQQDATTAAAVKSALPRQNASDLTEAAAPIVQ